MSSEDLKLDVGGTSIDCKRTSYRVRVGKHKATLKTIESNAFAWGDVGGEITADSGKTLYRAEVLEAFHARGLPVCNVYGATETGPFSIALDERHALTHPGSCGWPAPGVQVRLGNPVDGVGELLVRGLNVV